MQLSLRNKTILGIAVIEASLLLLLVFTAVDFMRSTMNEGLVKRASTITALFATTAKSAVLSYDLASLEAYSNELMKNPDIAYVRVINSDNQILAQAGRRKLLASQFVPDERLNLVSDGVFDSYALISEAEHTYGQVQLGIDISSIESSIKKIQNWTSSIALIEMFLVALFSFVLGTYLTRHLQGLRQAAKEISKNVTSGEYTHSKIQIRGKDELTEVAEAFNKLVIILEQEHQRKETYQNELEVLNQTLERNVQERTSLLFERNTQLEQSNQDLHEAQQQLVQAEKMASVGQLAAGVAHEINNPISFVTSNLNSLRSYIDSYRQLSEQVVTLLSDEHVNINSIHIQNLQKTHKINDFCFLNDDTKDLLNESIEGLTRVKNIVKDLKQFSRADSDDKQWFDINNCITTTLNMVNNQLKYHCTIEKNLNPVPKVLINVGKIIQVLTNLFINAGQAIHENGKITVSTRYHNNCVIVSIEDNGSGIEPRYIDKLFDPFFTTKEEGVGTGLGLSISYGIINDHNGELTVSSEINKGSCFCIILPTDENKKPSEEYIQ
ncbi:MAG: ATP-binding protein [Paraglaciecola sp.]|uniref:HAMP domain-containing sensor histidine kinase n=1 Tax=Paraglaciecola sp. TaxID=1920173 RepID=UPI003297A886